MWEFHEEGGRGQFPSHEKLHHDMEMVVLSILLVG
jgi:hypothetical protein